MAAKQVFSDEHQQVLHSVALRVWRRFKAEGKTQEDMALAMGISQQSVSALLRGDYRPGYKPARALANLEGKKLEDLLEGLDSVPPPPLVPRIAAEPNHGGHHTAFANLDTCIKFHASTKHWSAWTIAAARAGFFGGNDFEPPEWAAKLEFLEKVLEKARKG